jgi:hypothetical protein
MKGLRGEGKMHNRPCKVITSVLAVITMAACAAAPRARPLPTTAIDEGPNSTTAVRKQFEGRWSLVSLRVSAADGRQADLDATGELTFDAFGVLQVEYRLSDESQKRLAALGIDNPNPRISTTDRVVFDPQQQRITYLADDFEAKALGFDPVLAAKRANPFALERVRYYTLGQDGTLTLSTRYDTGKDWALSARHYFSFI